MNKSDLMTYGVIGFALFAAWYALANRPASAVQPGQAQRDQDLSTWHDQMNAQSQWSSDSQSSSLGQLNALLVNDV